MLGFESGIELNAQEGVDVISIRVWQSTPDFDLNAIV